MSVAPSDRAALTLEAALAEYQALRAEIAWLIEHGAQLQNYAIGLAIGLFPVAAFILDKQSPAFMIGLLLMAPLALCLLGLLYFRQHQEVYVIAAYITESVRPIISELSGRNDIWSWEDFKAARQTNLSDRSAILGIWKQKTILMLRLAIFALPAACSFVLALAVAIAQGLERIVGIYTSIGTIVLLFLAVVDLLIMVILTVRFSTEADLAAVVFGQGMPAASDR